MDKESDRLETRVEPRSVRRRASAPVRTEPVLGRPQAARLAPPLSADALARRRRRALVGVIGCAVGALAAVVVAVVLFGGGFAGPAPIALVAAGGFIAIGASLWGTTRPPAGVAAPPPGNRPDAP